MTADFPLARAGTLDVAGQTVPRFGYGTMRLTGPQIFGPPADPAEAVRVLRRAVELGIRVIDTAWYYGPYVAEELLVEALHPYPDDLVIVTKLGGARRDDASWYSALSDPELRAGCEHDLRLLKLDAIPVVHLRWMDNPDVPFEAALETLVALQREGKIRGIGLSNVTDAHLDTALKETDVATVSNAYSVLGRGDDAMVDRCAREGIPYLPFFPLGASPVRGGAGAQREPAVARVAERLGATPTQVALAWLLARSPAVLPIPGTSRVAHLEENVVAAGLELSPTDLDELDAG